MRIVNLSQFDNDWYSTKAGLIKRVLWAIVQAVFLINPLNPFSWLKVFLMRLFGAQIGRSVVIKPSVKIKYPWFLRIGNSTWIGENVWIENLCTVTIGSNVCISQGAMLLTGNHDYKKPNFDLMLGEITLMDGVWIGSQSLVCPGVTAHSHSVLTAGSVATKSMEAFTIYQGNPAVPVRKREIAD